MSHEPNADTLRALLESTGLSQVALARALGRDPRALRRWLTGEPIPPTLAHQLDRLVRIDVTPQRITIVLER